jgi:hypothetical protein
VEVVSANASVIVLRFTERVFDGKPDDPVERELALADDGASFVMEGQRFLHEPTTQVAATPTKVDAPDPPATSDRP